MHTKTIIIGAICVLVAGCQTYDPSAANANLSTRLEQYNGASMREFIERTGLTPVSAYPVSEGRVFVFKTAPVYITLPATNVTPAVTRSNQCQLLIRAVHKGGSEAADNWKIMGTQREGPCLNLPV